MDFGAWDGLPWPQIAQAEIDAWCADFLTHRPGGGETLQELLRRAAMSPAPAPGAALCVVAHGGWMLARRWLATGQPAPRLASQWPAAPRYGALWRLAPPASAPTQEDAP